MAKKLSFVIPCYGSEKTVAHVVEGIVQTVADKNPYEIVCVNDCSPDGVYSVLEGLAAENKCLKLVNLARNFGQHAAIMAGYHYVTGDIVINLDDDGQTDPRDCYTLIDALDEKTDIVYAKYPSKKESPFRLFGSWTAKKMSQWLCSIPKDIELNSYYACKRFVVDEMIRYENAYPYLAGLQVRATRQLGNVEVPHYEREYGRSGYSLRKLVALWMNGFTAFSVKPLRIATFIGAVTASLGFLYAVYTVIKKLLNPTVPMGYSSMMCALLFIGGMIMLMLGLIGEYIGRIYICLNKSPQYVVRNTVNI
ncbi:MAG: glycosyltransferase family 2 protein [Treponema sp.]|nr:glycosyltransferase family 2 protein [Treponema sp.]